MANMFLKRKKVIYSFIAVLTTFLLGFFFLAKETYICKGSFIEESGVIGSLLAPKVDKSQIQFSFEMNNFNKKVSLSTIEPLSFYAALLSRASNSSRDDKNSFSRSSYIYNSSGFEYRSTMRLNSPPVPMLKSESIQFDKVAKAFVLHASTTNEFPKFTGTSEKSINAICERVWFNF